MRWLVGLALILASCAAPPDTPEARIEPAAIAAHVRFLSHDLLEGRGVGGRGEALTVEYLATQLAVAGAAPAAPDGTYIQPVPLVELKAQPGSVLRLAGRDMAPLEEYVANNERQTGREVLEAELVYVGRGIVAPEFDWDDYKGFDITGKVAVLFTNEPPSAEDEFFGGKGLTYYGRWSFKYEEAARRGALGVLIVHTEETAGYGWNVVANSWSGSQIRVEAEEGEPGLALAGWVTSAAAEALFRSSSATRGKSLDELLAMANAREFAPIPLEVSAQADLRSSIVPVETANVLGRIEGSDPELKGEAVLYTAHWDHLGTKDAGSGEDGIFNGAVDNATGCAVLLEIARAFRSLPRQPARSVLFAFVGAEESGLLGSAYYAANPVVPMGRTALNLNYDGLFPFGRTSDFSLPGHERTTVRGTVESLAARFGVSLTPDAHPEQGYYYRSDQFSLAKRGVPAFSLRTGSHYAGRPEGWGIERTDQYRRLHYHQPSDEYRAEWDFTGIADLARFGLELGALVADQSDLPSWQDGDEFLAAREASWE